MCCGVISVEYRRALSYENARRHPTAMRLAHIQSAQGWPRGMQGRQRECPLLDGVPRGESNSPLGHGVSGQHESSLTGDATARR